MGIDVKSTMFMIINGEGGGTEKFTCVKFLRECSFVFLVNVCCRQRTELGNEEGTVIGHGILGVRILHSRK